MHNIYTASTYDPRTAIPVFGPRPLPGNRRYARIIRSRITTTGNWSSQSKRLPATLRGNTYSRLSERYADTRAIFDTRTGEHLGWIDNQTGRFCPAGE